MTTLNFAYRTVCMSLFYLILSGCFRPPYNDFHRDAPAPLRTTRTIGDALNSAAGRLLGKSHANNLAIISDLQKNDIQYVQHGDTMVLIVPTDHYFLFDSPKLNDICFQGLNNIIKLLELYPCSTIYVAGFTDNVGTRDRKRRLSQAQAETMLTFLWANNIHAQRLKAEGYGSEYDIGNNRLIHGSAYNRRIEIQWMNVPTVPKEVARVSDGMK